MIIISLFLVIKNNWFPSFVGYVIFYLKLCPQKNASTSTFVLILLHADVVIFHSPCLCPTAVSTVAFNGWNDIFELGGRIYTPSPALIDQH